MESDSLAHTRIRSNGTTIVFSLTLAPQRVERRRAATFDMMIKVARVRFPVSYFFTVMQFADVQLEREPVFSAEGR